MARATRPTRRRRTTDGSGRGGNSRSQRTRQPARESTPQIPLVEQIVTLPLTDITPYDANPRDNQAAAASVANSIRAFGFVVPVLLDRENVIVAGHTRYLAANQLEMEEIPCIYADHLTDEQIKQFRIIDNKVAELARWDFDALASELDALAEFGLDWTQFGFGQEELDCLTDVVGDDCLSSGAASELQGSERSTRASRTVNSRTRVVIGEFVFFIPAERYRQWASAVRNQCDFDDDAITTHLKSVLGMDEYLDGDQ